MTGRVREIEKLGYIVYRFYRSDRSRPTIDLIGEHKIKSYPTVLVFENGKVIKRFTDIVSVKDITEGVKKGSEQKDQGGWPDWLRLW